MNFYSILSPLKLLAAILSRVKAKSKDDRIKKSGRNVMSIPPPQAFKQLVIKEYGQKYGLKILIETGTYLGDTIANCKNIFQKVISIELDLDLFTDAKRRFANEGKIKLYQGDSGIVLSQVLSNIQEPCLFWLDGHYSEGKTAKGNLNTPILAELETIFDHSVNNHVILIDDARLFVGLDDYPSLENLHKFVLDKKPNMELLVENDIIRILQTN